MEHKKHLWEQLLAIAGKARTLILSSLTKIEWVEWRSLIITLKILKNVFMSVIFMNYRVADPFFAQSNRRENGERIYSRIDRVVANVD